MIGGGVCGEQGTERTGALTRVTMLAGLGIVSSCGDTLSLEACGSGSKPLFVKR